MIANICVPKLSRLLLSALGLMLLSSCLSLGSNRIEKETPRQQLTACSAELPLKQTAGEISWQLRYLGPAQPLATAKAPWGASLRYVIPYTRHTELYELTVQNVSKEPLWLDPESISLRSAGQTRRPLTLTFFERAWPAGAVRSDSELIDRSLALAEVTRTLFVKRPLYAQESYSAILPFLRSETQPEKLEISSWQRGEETISKDFCLRWQDLAPKSP